MHDDSALAPRSARAASRRPRAARRGRMARHPDANRSDDSRRRAAHFRPHGIREIPARTHRGAWPLPFGQRPLLHVGHETYADRTRAAPPSQGASPLWRPRHQCDGHARLGKLRPVEAANLAGQCSQQQGGTGVVRLAPDSFARNRGRLPHHPQRRPVPALGLCRRHVEAQLQLLHPRLSVRPAPGSRAPPLPVPEIRRLGAAHRPHAIPHAHTASAVDRRSGRARRNRISALATTFASTVAPLLQPARRALFPAVSALPPARSPFLPALWRREPESGP